MPSQEALDALGELVQRARQATTPPAGFRGMSARMHPTSDDAREITAPVPVIGADPGVGVHSEQLVRWPRKSGRWRDTVGGHATPRWLVRGVAVLATLVVLLGLADLVVFAGGHPAKLSTSPPTSAAAGAGAPSTTSSSSVPPSSVAGTSTSAPTTSTTAPSSTTSAPAGGGAPGGPRLTSVTPSRGRPGTVVVLRGKNFYSPASGVVLAKVDGQPAPTDCPTQSSCQVTIPPVSGRPHFVTVTVTTDSGTSNALLLRYS